MVRVKRFNQDLPRSSTAKFEPLASLSTVNFDNCEPKTRGAGFRCLPADFVPLCEGTKPQNEAPIVALEGHRSYDVRPHLWVSLDGNFGSGGITALSGIRNLATKPAVESIIRHHSHYLLSQAVDLP